MNLTVPEVREELLSIANDLTPDRPGTAETIRNLVAQLFRRPGKRSAPDAVPMTPELVEEIRAYRRNCPDASQHEIALYFNINQGRVSEVLNGRR